VITGYQMLFDIVKFANNRYRIQVSAITTLIQIVCYQMTE
jgi:hypothetical protein